MTASNGPVDAARMYGCSSSGAEGDREALEELYLLHFDRIYSYLHLSIGDRHDAEDLTTQTFLKMLEAIGRFRWQSVPFSAWLFRIAHNLAIDHFVPGDACRPRTRCRRSRGRRNPRRSSRRWTRSAGGDAGAHRAALARAAPGADAEVPLRLRERRGGGYWQDRGRRQVAPAPGSATLQKHVAQA